MNEQFRKLIMRADFLLVILVYPAAWVLRRLRESGIERFPRCKKALFSIGVFPIRDHYYEPLFDMSNVSRPFSEKRNLPGINWNIEKQLLLLKEFCFAGELAGLQAQKSDSNSYYVNNRFFEQGDAEFWYQLIRAKKPRRVFEIGSGYSTLIAIKAIEKNEEEDSTYTCSHVCIEPFEVPWLEAVNVSVLRRKVEDVELAFFHELAAGDILFIDSSHMIRPEGDVLYEYLEIIPSLNNGVIVHVHDIFSPRNYPERWLVDQVRFWNEQYLLEAFLSNNDSWEIVAALNYLHHDYSKELGAVCPFLTSDIEPKSFYMKKK